jgi:hypothetical protein
MKKFIGIGIVVLVVGAFLGGVYYAMQGAGFLSWSNLAAAIGGDDRGVITPTSGREVPAGFREYYNPRYHFSILYPEALKVKEFNEGEGAMTITFEKVGSTEGFQLFIVPYSKPQVNKDRLQKDLPSGVQKDLKSVTLAGATGAAFFSYDATIGETAEVWVIKNNFLCRI